jgi:NaMN:DMB phosphoribosyltransferase
MTGSASEALAARAVAALGAVEGLAVYDGPPVQAAAAYAVVETGPESDWGHKSGAGRELRLAATVWDKGERPGRLRALAAAAEAALGGLEGEGGGWSIVTMHFLRSRTVAPRKGSPDGLWAVGLEFRARMLAG